MLTLLPTHLHKCTHLLTPYLLISFGSFTRMDYGTGHEAAFGLFLLCLSLIRFFEPEPEEERSLVLVIFVRYLRLCWRLQDVYRLEPAGSHGVWGLDDSSFLGYILGSGQLKGPSILYAKKASFKPDVRGRPDGCLCVFGATPASTTDELVLSFNFKNS